MNSEKVKIKKFSYFIGIDVSRNTLDYAVIQDKQLLFHREALNEADNITAFLQELKTLPKFTMSKAVFCMEHTGIYCNHVLNAIKKVKGNVALENALQIRNSLGVIRGKYDKIDAIRIAQYASKNRDDLKLWVPARPALLQLKSLFALRNRLMGTQLALRTPLKEQVTFIKKGLQVQSTKLCKKSIEAIKADLADIEAAIDLNISSDENLKRLISIIVSVPNIGRITAIQIIISTNEFKDINNPKQFACYAGVAPFVKESGLFKGRGKVSPIANKKVKALLHICAMSAIISKGEIKDYFIRKTTIEGKPKMLVLNAIRGKLILRIFSCVNQNRHYQGDYRPVDQHCLPTAQIHEDYCLT
ncbi:transposase [Mucilaginibacter phyllosphaerae]|uniref:Transposase n=1 Tax=Mucilaginibacter phyllosphaerae TaxID=1812349 RepID=A0A4Y8AB98_9SPHI|nr:transposase [Mucilaginibacter phyllosphaerae]MBB3969389.1 transposase [Mucilaginibacter phyllosphaerae]TEW65824.1 IS110 family transposase [Mucilaginibacter phyllosphaerae]GGH08145.1 IS110 family transposase [Mucilaginibacter phyllosphaerae]